MTNPTDRQFQFFKLQAIDAAAPSRFLSIEFEDKASRNSFGLGAARELLQILRDAEASSCAGIIFRSQGAVFCSGGNLRDYAKSNDSAPGIMINREISQVLNELNMSRLMTIALVEGDCFGGGLELLSAFDEVIAVPGVLFGFWQRRIGLSFGWGGGHRLARRLGDQMLIRLAMEASVVFCPEALDLNLIDYVTTPMTAFNFAMCRLQALTRFSNDPVGPLKRLRQTMTSPIESSVFEELWWNADHRKALLNFQRI